jgi:hypothetical protein
MNAARRLNSLDGLRALAALGVLGYHFENSLLYYGLLGVELSAALRFPNCSGVMPNNAFRKSICAAPMRGSLTIAAFVLMLAGFDDEKRTMPPGFECKAWARKS